VDFCAIGNSSAEGEGVNCAGSRWRCTESGTEESQEEQGQIHRNVRWSVWPALLWVLHCLLCLQFLLCDCYLREGGYVFVWLCLFVCLCVSKITRKVMDRSFWYVGHGISYQWFNFGRDPAGILDSGSLWNFRYHCVKGGIREPLAKRRWWRHLANSFAFSSYMFVILTTFYCCCCVQCAVWLWWVSESRTCTGASAVDVCGNIWHLADRISTELLLYFFYCYES